MKTLPILSFSVNLESNSLTCVLVLHLLTTLGEDKSICSDVAQQIKDRVDGVHRPFRTHQLFCG